jgi:hypothetical protein
MIAPSIWIFALTTPPDRFQFTIRFAGGTTPAGGDQADVL